MQRPKSNTPPHVDDYMVRYEKCKQAYADAVAEQLIESLSPRRSRRLDYEEVPTEDAEFEIID